MRTMTIPVARASSPDFPALDLGKIGFMPVTPEVRDNIVAKLGTACNLRHKAMFGGIGLYCDEVFFALIDDDRLFFKVGPENLADYEVFRAGPWVYGKGEINNNYRELPTQILANPRELRVWIEKAVAVAQTKKKKSR